MLYICFKTNNGFEFNYLLFLYFIINNNQFCGFELVVIKKYSIEFVSHIMA